MTQKPIRFAILGTRGIPARYGGFETFAQELGIRLTQMGGFEVTVYCPASHESPQPVEFRGVKLRYVFSLGQGGLGNLLFDILSLCVCLGRHDVVCLCGYGASAFAFLPRILGAHVWINPDGLEWKRSKWPLIIRTYLKASEWLSGITANRLICDSKAILDYHARTYQPKARLSCIAYGVDPHPLDGDSAKLLPAGLNPFGYDLVVARLEPENKVLEIIEGFQAHASKRVLVVVGNLDDRPYVEVLRAIAGGRVVFLGGIYERDQLAALRRHAFAAFHGHSVGGTNPSLLEALAAGRPVIAHDNIFNREVGGSMLGYFKESSDIPAQLARLEGLGAAEDLDQFDQAKSWLEANYSWGPIASAYAALCREELLVD